LSRETTGRGNLQDNVHVSFRLFFTVYFKSGGWASKFQQADQWGRPMMRRSAGARMAAQQSITTMESMTHH
jgi:hypothetical protein